MDVIKVIHEQDRIVVHLFGRLDTASSMEAEKKISEIAEVEKFPVVMDCKELQYISSSGLRLFLMMLKKGKVNKQPFTVSNVSPTIKEIFKITGFLNILKIE
jgi:anti-sigma B factor antagonist